MKLSIVLTLLVSYAVAAGNCPTFTCGTVTNGCVGPTTPAANFLVANCPATQYCSAMMNPLTQTGYGTTKTSAATVIACNQKDAPNPQPLNSGIGEICKVVGDCKKVTTGAQCTSGVCRSSNALAGVCASDNDCDLGMFCAGATGCQKTIAPGQPCTLTMTPNQWASECGFSSYCLQSPGAANPVCVPFYSQPNGYVLPTGAANINQICQSGFAGPEDGMQSATITCQPGKVNNVDPSKSVAQDVGANCAWTMTPTKGAAIPGNTLAQCGYNQDANAYCPWQIGDPVPKAVYATLSTIYAYATTKCSPVSNGLILNCAAVNSQYTTQLTSLSQASYFSTQAELGEIGQLVANNAQCVKSTITAAYFMAFGASFYSMIGALFAVVALMF